jgi:hypothetical protein
VDRAVSEHHCLNSRLLEFERVGLRKWSKSRLAPLDLIFRPLERTVYGS